METERLPLACGDHSFPLLEHEHVLALVSMLGFVGFDLALMGNRSHIRPEDVRYDIPGAAERLNKVIAAAGLKLADVFLIPWTDFETLAPNHPREPERAEARRLFTDVLELAARLQSPGLTLVPGVNWPGEPARESLERAAEELQWRSERARSLGLRCSVEPHIGSVTSTPEDVLTLLSLAPDLELTLDYTHFVSQGITEDRIEPLANRARHFHARGAKPGRGQTSVRDSTIDYERVVDTLVSSGYDGYLAVEYVWIEWEHMNECDNLSETILMRDRLAAWVARRQSSHLSSTT
jgi:sugar phosphate isomerase/epimerase